MHPLLVVLIVILCVLAFIVLPAAWVSYYIAFLGKRRLPKTPYDGLDSPMFAAFADNTRKGIDRLLREPYETVEITSHDGLKLVGKYYHVKDGAPLQIQFHGYRGSAERDFSGGGCECLDKGHNLLLIHQRAHGISEGRSITFGVKERLDCKSWVQYAVSRFGEDVKIILMGISMGAATVLMASDLDLPKNVKAIVADCPYSSPIDIITTVAGYMRLPGKLLSPFIRLGAILFGGFALSNISAERAVRSSNIKTLIIHGEQDSFVPKEMSEVIAAARPDVKRVTFPGADHGASYAVCKDEYMRLLNEFIDEALAEQKPK